MIPIGYRVTPAGAQSRLGDQPLTVRPFPDGKAALVVNAGQGVQSLQVISTADGTVRQTIEYRSPEALFVGAVFSPDGTRAFVSAGGNNKIRTFTVSGDRLTETAPIPLPTRNPAGVTVNLYPADLAVTPDGRRLVVADQVADAATVIDVTSGSTATVAVGHAPYGVAVSPDGRSAYVTNQALALNGDTLYVANSGNNDVAVVAAGTGRIRGLIPTGWYPSSVSIVDRQLLVANAKGLGAGPNDGSMMVGTLSRVGLPLHEDQLAHWTHQVNENDGFNRRGDRDAAEGGQLLRPQPRVPVRVQRSGDRAATARRRVHLAAAGQEPRVLPQLRVLRQPHRPGGVRRRRPGAGHPDRPRLPRVRPGLPGLAGFVRAALGGLWRTGPVRRVEEGIRQYVAHDSLPAVQFVRLPNDHTAGTSPGAPTPRAYVADNDWALGQLVDAVSHSKYWKSTAIFVTEDDAQNGPDHVDAHRTLALAISPYTQTGRVDSTFYSTDSMLRTIELLTGLRPLTQFDAYATPMLGSFTNRPDFTPYQSVQPSWPLTEVNGPRAPMAARSAQQDLSKEDLIDEQVFNQAIWQSVKGTGVPMPAPRHSLWSSVPDSPAVPGAAPAKPDTDDR